MWFRWKLKEAEEEFLKGNQLDPSDINCIRGIFLLNLYLGDTDKARFWREKGLAVAPYDFWLNLFNGILLFFENKISESIAFLKNSVIQYNHPFYKARIGWIYTITRQYDSAVDILEKTLEQHKERRPAILANLAAAIFITVKRKKLMKYLMSLKKRLMRAKPTMLFILHQPMHLPEIFTRRYIFFIKRMSSTILNCFG
jgi:hypothetical protein